MKTDLKKQNAAKIFGLLKKQYPDAKPALEFQNPFQLLIATILSAQCTDERVNIVTESLFKKYRKPRDFVDAPVEELEKEIFSTGFYHQKAKSIKQCCLTLVNDNKGEVPADFEALTRLPGVGRKTASVVAGNAFGIPAFAVDTHVKRLSNLMGFVKSDDPEKIELKLKELLPESHWVAASHILAAHGRKVCVARRPKCSECVVGKYCPSFNPGDGLKAKVKK